MFGRAAHGGESGGVEVPDRDNLGVGLRCRPFWGDVNIDTRRR